MFPGRPIAGASRATREPRFPPTPATGCSNEIAKKIKGAGGDYVLAVKDNQPNLHQAIEEFFVEALEDDLGQVSHRRHETHEKGHGRVDDRYYYLAKLPNDFAFAKQWPGVKAIGMAIRVMETSDGTTSDDVRFRPSSPQSP